MNPLKLLTIALLFQATVYAPDDGDLMKCRKGPEEKYPPTPLPPRTDPNNPSTGKINLVVYTSNPAHAGWYILGAAGAVVKFVNTTTTQPPTTACVADGFSTVRFDPGSQVSLTVYNPSNSGDRFVMDYGFIPNALCLGVDVR